MRSATLLCTLALLPASALAQPEVLFSPGAAPVYKEQDLDKRFDKSKIRRGLEKGTQDTNCAHVLTGLLTLLGETAPYLHKRDENFYLDPVLVNALGAQLVNPRFPGNAYLASMVRRVWLDGRLPATWLDTARGLNALGGQIDIAKLQYLADGVRPIESFYFSFPALKARYDVEVVRANSAARATALTSFRDAYLDRDVAWSGAVLLDIVPPTQTKARGRKASPGDDLLLARLHWEAPQGSAESLDIFGRKKPTKPVIFEARLSPEQYLDLQRVPKGTRLLVRGRFWEMNADLTHIQLRDAVLFGERDWSRGAVLADPAAVARCPLAVNDLAGTAPVQPGGFGQRLGGGR